MSHKPNHWLIVAGWSLLAVYSVGMVVCLELWATNHISDRTMIGITLGLSWLALIEARIVYLVNAYTKRDVNS